MGNVGIAGGRSRTWIKANGAFLLGVIALAVLTVDVVLVGMRIAPADMWFLEGSYIASAPGVPDATVTLPGVLDLPGVPADAPVVVHIPVDLPESAAGSPWTILVGDPGFRVTARWDGEPVHAAHTLDAAEGGIETPTLVGVLADTTPGRHVLDLEVRGFWGVRSLEGRVLVGTAAEVHRYQSRREFQRIALAAGLLAIGVLWLVLATGMRRQMLFAWIGLFFASMAIQFFAWSDSWGMLFTDVNARLVVRESASAAATAFSALGVAAALGPVHRVPLMAPVQTLVALTYLSALLLPWHQRLDLVMAASRTIDVVSASLCGLAMVLAAHDGNRTTRALLLASLPLLLSVVALTVNPAGSPPDSVLPWAAVSGILGSAVFMHRHAVDSERFGVLFERARDAVVVATRSGDVVQANPAARALLGNGRPLVEAVATESRSAMAHHLEAGAEGRRAEVVAEGRQLDSLAVDLSDSEVLLVLRDISGRPEAERSLRNVARLETVGILASGVAHDFNNALVALLDHVETLEREAGDADSRARLASVGEAILRTGRMSRRIVEIVRVGPDTPTLIDVAALVRDTVGWTAGLLAPHLTVVLEIADELPPTHAVRSEIEQVLLNLLSNAASVTPRGGMLRVGLIERSGFLELSVDDEGPGVPDELRTRIWEPFYTTRPTGSGIGLTVVARIVRDLGGDVAVLSRSSAVADGGRPLAGARFVVRFPVHPRGPRSDASTSVRVVVLAASDERARTLRVALLERGFLVDIVDNAPDALVAARSADVLVVDLELATFDGHAFAVGAREVLPALRVVVVGGPEVTPPGFRCVPASATGESVAAAVRAVLFQDASEGPSH